MSTPDTEHPEIPRGLYCYKVTGMTVLPDGSVRLGTTYCPHLTTKEVNGVKLPWCALLQKGSVPLFSDLSEGDRLKLRAAWGFTPVSDEEAQEWVNKGIYTSLDELRASEASDFDVPPEFNLMLLWDGLKECAINLDAPEEPQTASPNNFTL